MPTVAAGQVSRVFFPVPGTITVTPSAQARVTVDDRESGGAVGRIISSAQNFSTDAGGAITIEAIGGSVTHTDEPMNAAQSASVQALVSGAGNAYIRWCIPGKDTSGTLFKDISGKGNDATIEANNGTPFAVDNRISTVAHASAGGVVQTLAATLCDFTTDSIIMAFAMTNEDPAGNESVASFGAGTSTGQPGLYVSHRASAAGVARVVANRGNGTLVSGSDSTVKFSNVGGTRETHALIAYDAPTGSVYLYRDGVLAAANAGLMTGANVWTAGAPVFGARLGSTGGTAATVAGVFRGWQAYVFEDRGLPLNIGRIAAMLAEAPGVPLRDHEFAFA